MESNLETRTRSSWIDGCYTSTSNESRWIDNLNPASGELLCRYAAASSLEVDAAVQACSAAQSDWARRPASERGRILARAAALLRERNDEIARLEVQDTGKPLSEALVVDVQSGADALDYFAGIAAALKGDYHELGSAYAYTRREPIGVVAGIGAWNYPLQIACWKAAPALAAGNGMLFKPSELTPLTALVLAEVFQEAGLPAGLFNVLLGDGTTGEQIVAQPLVRKVSVTGSVQTGKRVMAQSAQTLKRVTCELGGKSPLIIFELSPKAIQCALDANFYTQGEICSNGTRVFVHENIYEPFLEAVSARTQQLRVGDPMDESTEVGSLISQAHMQRVLQYIELGKQEGARLVCGGKRRGTHGAFIEPTIFADCHDEMRIVREEIFGPIMSVLPFSSEPEVIQRANATDYGLAAGVMTSDLQQAHRVSRALEAGICWVNSYNITPVEIPFGGVKQSGIGRENSEWALHEYTQLKTVYVEGVDS